MMNDKQRNSLQGQIVEAVGQRSPWELRQTRWYELRHHGLRRTNKPWPKAADLHWPLIDTAIEKLKPLFLQQALGMDVVASFVPMRQQLNAYTRVAEDWFNYKIRDKTNFVDEVLSWVDYTLMSGRGVMSGFWLIISPIRSRVRLHHARSGQLVRPVLPRLLRRLLPAGPRPAWERPRSA